MKKKKIDTQEVEREIEEAIASIGEITPELPPISPIHYDFAREDLNKLRDTVNEIIKRL